MRVYIGSDHAGFEVKQHLCRWLADRGDDVVDIGPHHYDAEDDYPTFCLSTAERVVADPGSLGIVLGGSGNGEQIAANKVRGARAALAWNVETARLAREHNDATIVGVGARQHPIEQIEAIIEAFLTTEFSGGDRHRRRIAQIAAYETRD